MPTATFVFACALDLLGRSAATFPPVTFIDHPPPGVSKLAEGYALPEKGEIVLITSTEAFVQARQDRCKSPDPIREIASVLVHEEWHVRHGADEAGAYDAQLITLLATGAAIDSQLFHKVKQAKLMVVAAAKRTAPVGVIASR